jgi:predicted permease
MALGADRWRVVRLLASEAAILSVVGGALGVGFAYAGVGVFLRYAPVSIPRLGSVAVDLRVLAVAAVVSLGTGIVAGLLPALRLTNRGPWTRLQAASRTLPNTSIGLRSVLVGGQFAVAVVLLSGAALLFNSFVRMRSVDPGFDPEGLVAVAVDTKGGSGWDFQAQWIAWDRLRDELRGLPAVESVALATRVPFTPPNWMPRLLMPGDPPETIRDGIAGYVITPGYLATVGTELLEGRDFDPRDRPDSERVALVNQSFSRIHLRGENPIGATIRWAPGTEWSPGDEWEPPGEWLDGEAAPVRIVGLVEDVVQASVEEGPRPAIYVPHTQGRGGPTVVIRTSSSAADVFPDLRRAAARFNPRVPPIDFGTLDGRIAATQVLPRFQTILVGTFALVAMLLAAAGLYASLAHSVGCRQQEMGVRMALGADRAGVLRLVLKQGMGLATAGLAVGVVATISSTRLLASFLYGVRPNDPGTLLMTAAALLLVSAVACLAPARKATSVDPVRVLRAE